jgi:2-(1,2-epoxy-1,2-dihydrophenyl)acetyl-CoA isomerase
MSDSAVILDKRSGVACLTLNTPDKLNALGKSLMDAALAALDDIESDPGVRAFILTGSGRAFCAGADLKSALFSPDAPEARAREIRSMMLETFHPLIERLSGLKLPTICAVNGLAAGGGVGLALTCDLVIAVPEASFSLVFVPRLGLVPDLASAWRFTRAFGRQRTIAYTYLGTAVTAQEALAAGLIWQIIPGDSLMDHAWETANTLATGPTRAYPLARRVIDHAETADLSAQLELEAEAQYQLTGSADFSEGLNAFFDKREPRFSGS